MERITKGKLYLYTACVFLSMWVLSATHAATGFLNPTVIKHYSLQGFQQGLPSSMSTVFSMIAFMLVIITIGKIRKPLIIFAGALVSGVSMLLMTNSFPFSAFIGLIACAGFACGLIDSVASASMSDLYKGKRSAQMMCALHAVYGLAGFLMPFAYQWMADKGARFQSAYLPLSVTALVLAVALLFVTRGKFAAFEARDASAMRFSLPAFKRLFTNRRIIMMTVILFALGMYFNGVLDFGKSFMGEKFGKYEAIVVSCLYFCIALSRLTMSFVKVDTHKFCKRMLFASFALLAVASFIQNSVVSLACMLLSMLACGPIIPFVLSMASEDAPEDRFLAQGVMLMFHFLGKTVFAPFFGQVEASSLGIEWAMMFTALSALLACAAAFLIPKKELK